MLSDWVTPLLVILRIKVSLRAQPGNLIEINQAIL